MNFWLLKSLVEPCVQYDPNQALREMQQGPWPDALGLGFIPLLRTISQMMGQKIKPVKIANKDQQDPNNCTKFDSNERTIVNSSKQLT